MTGRLPKFSVIIPVRNGSKFIAEQLDALMDQDIGFDWELIIADNGSTDDTCAIVRNHPLFSNVAVRIADASAILGVNHARNVGVAHATSDIVLFCDSDDRVGSSWALEHVTALSSKPLSITAGPLVVDTINSTKAMRHSRGLSQPIEWQGLAWGWGANFGMRRQVWETSGPFREDLQGGFDDVEFMIRAQRHGASFTWVENANVDYRLPTTRVKALKRFYGHGRMRVKIAQILPDVVPMPTLWPFARKRRSTTARPPSIETVEVHADRTERIGYSAGVIVGWITQRLRSATIRRRSD